MHNSPMKVKKNMSCFPNKIKVYTFSKPPPPPAGQQYPYFVPPSMLAYVEIKANGLNRGVKCTLCG